MISNKLKLYFLDKILKNCHINAQIIHLYFGGLFDFFYCQILVQFEEKY